MSLPQLLVEGALYISGALLYAERVPECLWPGKFDLFVRTVFASFPLIACRSG